MPTEVERPSADVINEVSRTNIRAARSAAEKREAKALQVAMQRAQELASISREELLAGSVPTVDIDAEARAVAARAAAENEEFASRQYPHAVYRRVPVSDLNPMGYEAKRCESPSEEALYPGDEWALHPSDLK